MKYLPKNTLAYFNSAPQFHRMDLAHIPTAAFAASTKKYRENCGQTVPDQDALKFYVLNHLASLVKSRFTPNEPLPDWAMQVMNLYLNETTEQGLRMLHYVLSICTREMRHLQSGNVSQKFWTELETQFTGTFKSFLVSICSVHENEAVSRYMNNPPDLPISRYIGGLAYGFHKGKWSSGFGGHAWGNVADACVSFIEGKTSMEALVDTGFTLAHNNGPIFNKGMMYSSYTGQFKMILDVQRSGQVPELLLDKQNYSIQKPKPALDAIALVQKNLPDEFRGWVDWYKVEALGALGKYEAYKQKQKQMHPTVSTKKVAQKAGKQIQITGEWAVAPGQVVQVYERVA